MSYLSVTRGEVLRSMEYNFPVRPFLNSFIVRAPRGDACFDLLRIEILSQRSLDQRWKLSIRGEPKRDQLPGVEAIRLGGRDQRGDSLPLFQADHAVLDLQRLGACLHVQQEQCERQYDQPEIHRQAMLRVAKCPHHRKDEVEEKDRQQHKMRDSVGGSVALGRLFFRHGEMIRVLR